MQQVQSTKKAEAKELIQRRQNFWRPGRPVTMLAPLLSEHFKVRVK